MQTTKKYNSWKVVIPATVVAVIWKAIKTANAPQILGDFLNRKKFYVSKMPYLKNISYNVNASDK